MIQVSCTEGGANSLRGNRPKPRAATIMPTIMLRRAPQRLANRPAGMLKKANDSAPTALTWPIN